MTTRPRIDLDGVSLSDDTTGAPTMVLAIFRYRTTDGLILLLPESADVLVAWEHIEDTSLDLKGGTLRIRFTEEYTKAQAWLRGARAVVGTWTDRYVMSAAKDLH